LEIVTPKNVLDVEHVITGFTDCPTSNAGIMFVKCGLKKNVAFDLEHSFRFQAGIITLP